jgi:DNA protecting protein DprA
MDSILNDAFPIYGIERDKFPGLLAQTPKLPDSLRVRGALPPQTYTYITVVGSRKYSDYGKEACETLIQGLAGLPVVIVSGLALGIDSIAHRAALDCGLLTIAVPGSGLDDRVLYPATHFGLARQILEGGGALVSPFADDAVAAPWTFPIRNGIMAGISCATLVIEADLKSGTLITSTRATDLSRDVLALPGPIFSPHERRPQSAHHATAPLPSPVRTICARLSDLHAETLPRAKEELGRATRTRTISQKTNNGSSFNPHIVTAAHRSDALFSPSSAETTSRLQRCHLIELEIKGGRKKLSRSYGIGLTRHFNIKSIRCHPRPISTPVLASLLS